MRRKKHCTNLTSQTGFLNGKERKYQLIKGNYPQKRKEEIQAQRDVTACDTDEEVNTAAIRPVAVTAAIRR